MLESGIDPATVRFEVGVKIGNKCYCKYSIFLLENDGLEIVHYTHGSRIDPRFQHF